MAIRWQSTLRAIVAIGWFIALPTWAEPTTQTKQSSSVQSLSQDNTDWAGKLLSKMLDQLDQLLGGLNQRLMQPKRVDASLELPQQPIRPNLPEPSTGVVIPNHFRPPRSPYYNRQRQGCTGVSVAEAFNR